MCFSFCLVESEPLVKQLVEIGKPPAQSAIRFRFKRKQLTIGKRLHRCRARRAVQDRQFTEEITLAIKGEVALFSIERSKSTRFSFLQNVERAGIVSLTNDQIPFYEAGGF